VSSGTSALVGGTTGSARTTAGSVRTTAAIVAGTAEPSGSRGASANELRGACGSAIGPRDHTVGLVCGTGFRGEGTDHIPRFASAIGGPTTTIGGDTGTSSDDTADIGTCTATLVGPPPMRPARRMFPAIRRTTRTGEPTVVSRPRAA
jgi:hypothetical protein